jgi:hypothetical protein
MSSRPRGTPAGQGAPCRRAVRRRVRNAGSSPSRGRKRNRRATARIRRVHAGDVLAELSNPELEAALVLAKAQLGFAQLLPRSATSGHARDLDRVTGFDPKTPSPARGRMVGFAPPVATFPSSWACKPSSHSMTLSACTSNDGGTVRPSFLAVFMLITSSNLVGSSIGRLPGFAPFNMRST